MENNFVVGKDLVNALNKAVSSDSFQKGKVFILSAQKGKTKKGGDYGIYSILRFNSVLGVFNCEVIEDFSGLLTKYDIKAFECLYLKGDLDSFGRIQYNFVVRD